jgi:DnaJ homolog subfamily C member 27
VLVKILSVGDPEVGKSCLIKRYCEGRFIGKYISTIGVDYGVKKMIINSRKVAINFFDLSGDEDFKDIRNAFFRDAQGVLLVCSLTKRSSF